MLSPDDPTIGPNFAALYARIKAQGVEAWLSGKAEQADRDGLVYLCKFCFFTGIITKREIAETLQLERRELKELVKGWYDDHRERGCGTC